MPNYLLNRSSVIMCPHGGMVTHVPTTFTTELVNGNLPLLLTDLYFVAGCPNLTPEPCQRVQWATASPTRKISGVPVLTTASVGLCESARGTPTGPAAILSHQVAETE